MLGQPLRTKPFTGDASQFTGTYKEQVRGREMVIVISQTQDGLAVSVDGEPARPLQWVEGFTFRLPIPLLTFRRSANSGPVSEFHFDTGGDHFVLKRQP